MQESISRIFYLVLVQACVGGFVLLPITPRKAVPAPFFRVMGGIFLCSMVLAGWAFWASNDTPSPNRWRYYETYLLYGFIASLALYTVTTFVPHPQPGSHEWQRGEGVRVNLFAWVAGSVTGVGIVIVSALSDPLAGASAWEATSLALNFAIATCMLGAVTNGMLFGHWFLVDPHMSLEPIKRLILIFGISLTAALGLFAINALTLDTSQLLGEQARFHTLLFWMRMLFGTVSSLLLAVLTWRCLILGPGTTKYHATRAATGLLYVAMLTAFSGELLGRFLLMVTQVPV